MAGKKKRRKKQLRKKRPRPNRPLPLAWEFGPDVPTDDFFEGHSSDDIWGEPLENFIHMMEQGEFLVWEAVMAREQGLRLTRQQQAALDGLISFNAGEEDRVLYINEMARPSEPWYAILNTIAPHLLIEPFRTFDPHYAEQCEGWPRIVYCLKTHAEALSLPDGATSPIEVVPLELRHKLWLQECFDALSGLGQDAELTLEDEQQRKFRIDDFTAALREHKDSVRYFDLTLDSLLTKVILPERDRPILIGELQNQLGIGSTADRLADYL